MVEVKRIPMGTRALPEPTGSQIAKVHPETCGAGVKVAAKPRLDQLEEGRR